MHGNEYFTLTVTIAIFMSVLATDGLVSTPPAVAALAMLLARLLPTKLLAARIGATNAWAPRPAATRATRAESIESCIISEVILDGLAETQDNPCCAVRLSKGSWEYNVGLPCICI